MNFQVSKIEWIGLKFPNVFFHFKFAVNSLFKSSSWSKRVSIFEIFWIENYVGLSKCVIYGVINKLGFFNFLVISFFKIWQNTWTDGYWINFSESSHLFIVIWKVSTYNNFVRACIWTTRLSYIHVYEVKAKNGNEWVESTSFPIRNSM